MALDHGCAFNFTYEIEMELNALFDPCSRLGLTPYQKWVDNYAGEEFSEGVVTLLGIVDKFFENANGDTQKLMLKAFENSMVWEYRFWEDSYNFNYFL